MHVNRKWLYFPRSTCSVLLWDTHVFLPMGFVVDMFLISPVYIYIYIYISLSLSLSPGHGDVSPSPGLLAHPIMLIRQGGVTNEH